MSFFDDKEFVIPEMENTEAKEVYAFFGLCMYYLQVLEEGLTNLRVMLWIQSKKQVSSGDIDKFYQSLNKKTLGQLIYDLREHITLSSEVEIELNKALKQRNYIAHNFFAAHDVDFLVDNGRRKMIEELQEITTHTNQVDKQIDEITHSLMIKLGFTKEVILKELEKMNKEAESLNADS